jgi:hypothetical protein
MMVAPLPHRKHHAACAAAHFFLMMVALAERAFAVAAAEATVALVYADMVWRDRT